MGTGIAQLAARHGCTVRLIEINGDVLRRSLEEVRKRLDRSVEKGTIEAAQRDAILARIQPGHEIEGLEAVELAIEAVVEDLAVKQRVFASLEEATPRTAVLATNTSSLSITKIAQSVKDPSRVVGMHFFNPAPVMPLVEIIAGKASGEAFLDLARKTARAWGKTPVRAKDTPGFIVNRVARGYYLEALRLLGEGVAGVDEIDAVMKRYGGFRMGPFELMDLVGLDVNLAVSTSVWEQMGKPARFAPHEIQRELVEQGCLGRKSSRGFYLYEGDHPLPAHAVHRRSYELTPLLSDAMLAFTTRAGAGGSNSTEQYVFTRILGAILNEAGHAYSDGVADSDDIDVAMLKGTNYAVGPLAWADAIGHRTVRGLLKRLNEKIGDGRYEPASLFAKAY